MKSWQRLQNCVTSPTHLSMWMQPRQLTPCDMLILPAKWLYFSHSKLTRCPWHWRFEMVKSREESERDPALALCVLRLQSYSCFIAAWCREEKERGREKLGGVEKEKKRGRKKEQERERAGSPGFLSHPLRHPVLSLTHRPTFYLTYLAPAFNIIRHSVCFYFNAQDIMYTIHRYQWVMDCCGSVIPVTR